MNLALNYWFSQWHNTRILTVKLVTILLYLLTFQLTFYNRTITRFIADDKRIRLFISAWDGRCDWLQKFRQQLSTTLFGVFELEITVNYPVHTWTENVSFMQNLTSWSVPFWLVLLTEHKVLHCAERGLPLPGCRTIVPVLQILFSRLLMLCARVMSLTW